MARHNDEPEAPAAGSSASSETTDDKQGWWLKRFLRKHHRKLWWIHSVYALLLGVMVMVFAQKGFTYAQWLAPMLIGLWALLLVFFRIHGQGKAQKQRVHDDGSKASKLRFYVMTYFLKNLYQAMLFFLLPFYWKSTTFDHANMTFVIVLAVCAFLSTMDVVFDNLLMRFRALSSVYYGITLFAGLNLAVPSLFPDISVLSKTLAAASLTVVMFWATHVSWAAFKQRVMLIWFLLSLGLGLGGTYLARNGIPPVPLSLADAAVGPELLDDGRLAMRVTELHVSRVDEMYAVTDVLSPGGRGDSLHHVWRKDGEVVTELAEGNRTTVTLLPSGLVRLSSQLQPGEIPAERVGMWSIDVETAGGQLVGRHHVKVIE